MLKSMTGFGRGASESGLGVFTCEIRTLNHRYLDISVRSPRELQGLDTRIKDLIKEAITRGRVEIFLDLKSKDYINRAHINPVLAKNYFTNLKKLGKELKLNDVPSLSLLCRMPGVVEPQSSSISDERVWADVKKSITAALKSVLAMRIREGAFTERDIKKRIKEISRKLTEIKKRMPVLLNRLKKKGAPGEIPAKAWNDADVNEELSRLSSHLNQLNIFLKEKEAGKKINFTVQEMMREVNTISAKANDFPVSRAAVSVKTELEKVKEQIQNIE